jgi:signal transduction histidine kinase
LFAGNVANLQAIASAALRQADVRAVRILASDGQTLAAAGTSAVPMLPALAAQEQQWVDHPSGSEVLVQPVLLQPLGLESSFEEGRAQSAAELRSQPLGHVVVEVSRTALVARRYDMLMIGLGVTLLGLLFGSVLAVRIGQGVIRPILRVSKMIERIGRGELSVRGVVLPDDPLRDLQLGLNQMAERLQQGRDELERRVALATAELRAKKEEAETATLAKSRFLAAASHDLRQPIHALGMFVARLAQLPHDRETRQLIDHLEASVRAIQDLLDALLDISRLEANAVQVHRQAFALDTLFEQLRSAMQPEAVDKGLRLRIRSSHVYVLSDPSLLHRILLNLLSNALRYTSQGGVLMGCRRIPGGSHVWIEIWDTGVGIAPEHQRDIFREFYQIGNTERDRSKGLGLGLNIVERTARLLGHELQLCSIPGRGTRFRLQVPLSATGGQDIAPKVEDATQLLNDLRGVRVLVVEDDAQSAQALHGLLQSWGCEVALAESWGQARAHTQGGFVPDLVISDYRLRDGDSGLLVIQRLRETLVRNLPACLLSGDTDPALIQVCREAGLPLLHKPVRPAKLRTLMRRLMRLNA